jgi:uncharacterized protein
MARPVAKRHTGASKKKSVTRARGVVKRAARASPPEVSSDADEFSARGGLPYVERLPPEVDGSRASHAAKEYSWAAFDAAVQSLAAQVKSFRPQVVVGLVHGGVFVGGALASMLRLPFFSVRITARSRDKGNLKQVSKNMPDDVKGQRVLLVDDIAGSGDSLEFAARLAKATGAKSTKTVALVQRPKGFSPDFSALVSEDLLIFPWDYQTVSDDSRFDPDTAGA